MTCRGIRSASSSATAACLTALRSCAGLSRDDVSEQGELERLLGPEARIQAKVKAASGVHGMEAEVIEGLENNSAITLRGSPTVTRSYSMSPRDLRRVHRGGAAVTIDGALAEGEVGRVLRLPWGIGAAFVKQRADAPRERRASSSRPHTGHARRARRLPPPALRRAARPGARLDYFQIRAGSTPRR